MEVTQARFAKMAGVSRAAVCAKIKNKTLILNSGGMLDTDNLVNRAYLDEHQARAAQDQRDFAAAPIAAQAAPQIQPAYPAPDSPAPARQTATSRAAPYATTLTDSTAAGIPEYMLGLTIRELIAQHGTAQNIERYVKILRDLTTADEKDQRLRERRATLIQKDFVTSNIFGLLEQMLNKLLDMPERTVDNLIALAASNAEGSRQQIINTMRGNISVLITDIKDLMVRQLESLKGKYDETPQETLQELKEKISEFAENRGE